MRQPVANSLHPGRITDGIDAHAAERPDCRACGGTGLVCEAHPNLPWDDGTHDCGAPGMPCLLIDGEARP